VINDSISKSDDDDNESGGSNIELTTEDNTKILKDKCMLNIYLSKTFY